MHAVIRRYDGASALAEAMAQRQTEVEELLRGVPGFVAYYALREGDHVATVTVCDDQAGTEESTRRAGKWVMDNMPNATLGTPEVTSGEVYLNFA